MKTYGWDELRRELVKPEDEPEIERIKARMEAEVLAYRLAEARRRRGLTQVQLAEAMDVSQARISKIERGAIDRTELETIRSYVVALGGRLKLVADFGDETMVLG